MEPKREAKVNGREEGGLNTRVKPSKEARKAEGIPHNLGDCQWMGKEVLIMLIN
jgi:hypothetical protein